MPSDRRASFRPSRRRALTIGGAAAASVVAGTGLPRSGPSGAPSPADGPFQRIHGLGITGSDVRVGVLDTTGFDPGRPALSESTEALRGFGTSPVAEGTSHGTAAAATVAELVPDADLVLASVAGPDGFEAAVDWCRDRGVDVLLAPVAAHGAAATPDSTVFRAARDAARAGVTFVAPTGNAAQGHWQGPYGALRNDGRSATRLRVRPGSGNGRPSGRLVAWLIRHGPPEVDLTLALLRLTDTGDGRNLIALSDSAAGRRRGRLVADLDPGRYVLAVRSGDLDPVPAGLDRLEVEVVTATHRLAPARPAGSVAVPAAAPGVLAVGALSGDRVAPYSGRGPTVDGQVGVDLLAAPRPWVGHGSPGTSAAAARAAAAAALVSSAEPDLEPDAVVDVLRRSAGDVGGDGVDFAAGWGRLAPLAAVQRARSE